MILITTNTFNIATFLEHNAKHWLSPFLLLNCENPPTIFVKFRELVIELISVYMFITNQLHLHLCCSQSMNLFLHHQFATLKNCISLFVQLHLTLHQFTISILVLQSNGYWLIYKVFLLDVNTVLHEWYGLYAFSLGWSYGIVAFEEI